MEDLIKVKCPFCVSLLQFKKRVDFICPVCKRKSLVADCLNSFGKKDKEKTDIEDNKQNSATGDRLPCRKIWQKLGISSWNKYNRKKTTEATSTGRCSCF